VIFGVDPYTLVHAEVRAAVSSPVAKGFKPAMMNEGVGIMGTGEFTLPAVHTEADVDATAEAFERVVRRCKRKASSGSVLLLSDGTEPCR
jgi:hypothetical protein